LPPPRFIHPQLCQLVTKPPGAAGWVHEYKYDGYRMHIRLEDGDARLLTRTGLDWTDKYPAVAKAASKLRAKNAYVDGELCAVVDGAVSFSALHGGATDLVYYGFDLLHLDGKDLSQLSLVERKEMLKPLLRKSPLIYSEHFTSDAKEFHDAVCRIQAEGMISKRADAPYAPGNRGIWQKVKCHQRDEFIIVGYSDPGGSRHHFGSLLLGYYDDGGRLLYAGRVGTGLSGKKLADIFERLQPLRIDKMPLAVPPPRKSRFGAPLELSRVHWVKPKLVCEVRYLTWTADDLLRHTSFEGMRNDKPARQVRRARLKETA
jgi:bifunctional non-homologous end joining protein LigD